MNRRRFIATSLWLSAGLSAVPAHHLIAKRDYHQIEPIRRNVGYFTGRGGTIGWYADSESAVIVDAQFPPSANVLYNEVQQYNTDTIIAVINTHHHADHTAGNYYFQNIADQIVAQANVPEMQRTMAEIQNTVSEQAYAEVTFDEKWSIDAGNEIIHVHHYGPAHTAGDSVVRFENANVIHMGDLVFNRWYPFIDVRNGASITNWIRVLDTVIRQSDSDTIFIFGHGSANNGITGNMNDVKLMKDYLASLLEFTKKNMDEGKQLGEIIRQPGLDGFPNHVSAGARLSLSANIQAAWQELNGHL
jgi:cyclase